MKRGGQEETDSNAGLLPGTMVVIVREKAFEALWRTPSPGNLDVVGHVSSGEPGLVVSHVAARYVDIGHREYAFEFSLCLFGEKLGWIGSGNLKLL